MSFVKVKLSSISSQIRGVSYKPTDVFDTESENSATLLRANNIYNDEINYDDLVYVNSKRVSEEQYLKKGDILICTSSGSKHLVGKAACYTDSKNVSFGAFCKVIRPQNVNYDYLQHYFFSPTYRRIIASLSEGANINNIKTEDLNNLEIPLPSEKEQEKIAKELSYASALIKKNKLLLEKYDILIKSRFIEMFGDPVTNPMGWNVKNLDSICDGIGDGLHGTPEYDEKGNYPFINGNNLNDGVITITPTTKFVNEEQYRKLFINISLNAVLVSINGTLGKLSFYNGENVCLGKSACYCNLKDTINKIFIFHLMKTNGFNSYLDRSSTKSTIKNVGLKAMRDFKVILPPPELQQQFADFVQQIDKSKFEIWRYINFNVIIKDIVLDLYDKL